MNEQVNELNLVGIEVRTNNKDEMSGNGQIGKMWMKVFQENFRATIENVQDPYMYAVYSNYESDERGAYDYFIGYRVKDLESIPQGLVGKKIKAGVYQKYVTESGSPDQTVPSVWMKIWEQPREQRLFQTDYEVYGRGGGDPSQAPVEIYVGIKS